MFVTLVVAFAVSACGILEPVSQERKRDTEVVLSGFLTPDAPVSVTLRRTLSLDAYYPGVDLAPDGISDANVTVRVHGSDYTLRESDPIAHPGVYADSSLLVTPLTTYAVDVTFPATHEFSDRHITASTTVPSAPSINATLDSSQAVNGGAFDNLLFPKELADPKRFGAVASVTPFFVEWERVDQAGGYVVAVTARDTLGTGILRADVYENWLDGDFRSPQMRELMRTSSGAFFSDDSLHTDVFWLLFTYEGWHDVQLFACDDAYFDYFRSITGGAGMMGADADRGPAMNVRGGIGVFGSYARDVFPVCVNAAEYLPSRDQ